MAASPLSCEELLARQQASLPRLTTDQIQERLGQISVSGLIKRLATRRFSRGAFLRNQDGESSAIGRARVLDHLQWMCQRFRFSR